MSDPLPDWLEPEDALCTDMVQALSEQGRQRRARPGSARDFLAWALELSAR